MGLVAGTRSSLRPSHACPRIDDHEGRVQSTGGTPSAMQAQEISRLQAKLAASSKTVVVLVLLTTTLMAIARYL